MVYNKCNDILLLICSVPYSARFISGECERNLKKNITLKEVAARAGVSVTIASRVLSNYGSFSEETRKKVIRSAEELNYRPNRVAQALKAGRTKAIGVIVNSVTETFWMNIYRGIESTAQKYGYQVFLCNSDNGQPEKEQAFLQALNERGVDGIILSPSLGTHTFLRKIHRGKLPLVLVESTVEGLDVSSVIIDNKGGAFEAVEYLISLGHRRIAFIKGCRNSLTSLERLEGYKRALTMYGIPFSEDLVASGEYTEQGAAEATVRLLESGKEFTALFVSNESMMRGTLTVLKERNIKVPDDLSLIGWDNPEWAGIMTPSLTSVDGFPYDIGTIASQHLFNEIETKGEREGRKSITIKTKLVVRDSCIRAT